MAMSISRHSFGRLALRQRFEIPMVPVAAAALIVILR